MDGVFFKIYSRLELSESMGGETFFNKRPDPYIPRKRERGVEDVVCEHERMWGS